MSTPRSAPARSRSGFDRRPQRITLGRSFERRPIVAHVINPKARRTILVLGGFHGDEPKSVAIARQLVAALGWQDDPWPGALEAQRQRRTSEHPPTTRPDARWIIVPLVNPDGYERRRRRNASGVDLNRNFPTDNWQPGRPRSRMYGGIAPASEPETRAVVRTVERYVPDVIVTIHSISDGRFCNNYDGPGEAIARRMARHNRYPVTNSIGYPTPGSFGTWAGVERGIPTITLELPSHHSAKRCWADNRPALLSLE